MLSLLLLFLSPVAHYLWQATPFALWVAEGDTAVDLFYSRDTTLYPRESLKLVGAYLRSNLKPGEKLVVLGSSATLVYYQAHYLPDIPIYHSAFLLAPFAPEEWRRFVGGYMVRERPRFIVVEEGDLHPLQTGTQETSIDLLRTLPGVDSLVRGSYRREMYSGCYLVLERTDTSPPSGGG
jgi:hypothetical protein